MLQRHINEGTCWDYSNRCHPRPLSDLFLLLRLHPKRHISLEFVLFLCLVPLGWRFLVQFLLHVGTVHGHDLPLERQDVFVREELFAVRSRRGVRDRQQVYVDENQLPAGASGEFRH